MAVFPPLFTQVADPRAPGKIIYPLTSLAFAAVLMFLCRLGARRQVGLLLRNAPAAAKFQALFGVDTCPHGDTLNALFGRLEPDHVQAVVTGMTATLVRKKVLYPYRLCERFFVVAIDGTGMLTFHTRHCPTCLTSTHHGQTLYYHSVLEAKLVTPTGFAFSLMSEFIENPGAQPTKQDCELKAFYRLAARLKARFPRLPLLLSLDGLFAGGPTFALCRQFGWHYMIVLKDDDLPGVNAEFDALWPLQPDHRLSWRTGRGAHVRQDFRWVTDILYVDSAQREHTLAVLECLETKPDTAGMPKTTKFKWVTDCRITVHNVTALANDGGRIRWKVENEGFNVQKHGGFGLEHAYSHDPTAAKVFYFLLQMAHLLAQLLEKGSLLKQTCSSGFGSAKNLAFRLLEAWRNARLTREDFDAMVQTRFQIRFDSS